MSIFMIVIGIVALISGVLRTYSFNKRLSRWCWQRKLLVVCWSIIAMTNLVIGLWIFIHDSGFNFYTQFAYGIQYMIFVCIPCDFTLINKSRPLRVARNLFFIGAGATHVYAAFQI